MSYLKNDEGWAGIIGLLVLIIITIVAVVVVTNNGSPGNTDNIASTKIVEPVDYGNGVYYFDCIGSTFANSLSSFIEIDNVTILSITGDGNGAYGTNLGYFVVAQQKGDCLC